MMLKDQERGLGFYRLLGVRTLITIEVCLLGGMINGMVPEIL
jgi:hypothetical protein